MAHKLAILFYRILRHGSAYVDIGQEAYEAKWRDKTVKYLQRRARDLGLGCSNRRLTPPDRGWFLTSHFARQGASQYRTET